MTLPTEIINENGVPKVLTDPKFTDAALRYELARLTREDPTGSTYDDERAAIEAEQTRRAADVAAVWALLEDHELAFEIKTYGDFPVKYRVADKNGTRVIGEMSRATDEATAKAIAVRYLRRLVE